MTTRERILAYVEQADHSPTIREIAKEVGLKSPATVQSHLAALERAGLIRRFGEQRRIYPTRSTA